MMKILKQGAEAVIYSEEIDGQKFLVKERIKKKYRLEQIDEKLRKERTRQEMKLMREARGHGVLTPKIISSDESSHKIVMEEINGTVLKNFLEKQKKFKRVCFEVGVSIGKLHSAGIIHGDLTTSNMIVSGDKIYFVDFGLGQFSRRIEDMATDLSVLVEALRATHNKVSARCWNAIVKGYKSENKKYSEVFKRIDEIESRARYKDKAG